MVTAASVKDGRQLRRLVRRADTGLEVWVDTSHRSQSGERLLATKILSGPIHRRKLAGEPVPRNMTRTNAKKSAVRAAVERVFARQKGRFR